MSPAVAAYFRRFGFCERQITAPPPHELGIVVVIPCFDEPDLIGSLASLWACTRPAGAVEVIVVINSARGCDPDVLEQNQRTFQQASQWMPEHTDPRLAFHVLHCPDLPVKQSGVGLARKIGMDEAVRRFDDLGRLDGIVLCFDADCQCATNYLVEVERHFQKHPRSVGCSLYFEHPLTGPLEPRVYEAIAAYELHLRYHLQALRFTGHPHAHHTIGSSMAVRAAAYLQQGGMNKRQAGEDFYFLQKLFPLGEFTNLTTTTVFPSPRPSNRVPFGTGRAVGEYLRQPAQTTYPLSAFLDLRECFNRVPDLQQGKCVTVPEALRDFLESQQFAKALAEIRANTASEATFRKRLFRWFDGFRVMKFLHHARDHFYGEGTLATEVKKLLEITSPRAANDDVTSIRSLLEIFRRTDRDDGG